MGVIAGCKQKLFALFDLGWLAAKAHLIPTADRSYWICYSEMCLLVRYKDVRAYECVHDLVVDVTYGPATDHRTPRLYYGSVPLHSPQLHDSTVSRLSLAGLQDHIGAYSLSKIRTVSV